MGKYSVTIICFLVTLLPSLLYFVVNFYWWLFNGNEPNPDKMFAAALAILVGSLLTGIAADNESY